MKSDPDLAVPREREDFHKLLADISANLPQVVAADREAVRREPDNDQARYRLAALLNDQEWELATDADPNQRNATTALSLAEETVALGPDRADCWNTLGVARYRAGDFDGAIVVLQKFRELRANDQEWTNPFCLAMAHWQLGKKDEARQWYDRAVDWMEKEPSRSSKTMKQFRREAAELLGVNETR